MSAIRRAACALALCATAAAAQQDPPRRLELGTAPVEEVAPDTVVRDSAPPETPRVLRNAYVRNQLILGVVSYGPSFAVMLGSEPATRLAGWMVMAGASFFAASEVARQVEITPARQVLSTRMAWRGSATGLLLGHAWKMPEGEIGALTLVGGLSGAAAGLLVGGGLTEGEAVASVVGHDLVAASVYGLTWVFDPREGDTDGLSRSARVAIPLVLGWGGYALGRHWAGNASYEVTAGDAQLLWLGAAIGAAGASTFIIEGEPTDQLVAGTLVAGGLVGVLGADRLLVRRFDHTRSEGALVASGSAAGALMGIGLGVLVSGDAERSSAPTLAFATLGAIGGAWLTERYAQPARDEGRRLEVGSRVQFTPLGALAAARGVPGRHSILRITF